MFLKTCILLSAKAIRIWHLQVEMKKPNEQRAEK